MLKEKLIDTHCHLEMSQYKPDRDDVIKRAFESGLKAMITVASDIGSNTKAIGLAEKHDFIYCTIGLHPHDAKDFSEDFYKRLHLWTSNKKVVAIGETGLDYHYMHSPKEIQQDVFIRQLRLAIEKDLPVVVHSREAAEDTMRILRESGVKKGVLHCFSGDMDMAEEAMSMGLYISIAGPVTFKKSTALKEIAGKIPDDYLLIETDAPYLTPEPHRGKRNEPSYIVNTAEEIARLRGVSTDDVARLASLNAVRLFGLGLYKEKGVIAYKIRDSLYLNLTNRCTNKCLFCVRYHSDFVKGHYLRLDEEPTSQELIKEIGNPKEYKEIVFCGYGEPLLRLDVVKEVSSWVKSRGGLVRINTNGQANRIHNRNILPELKGIVDSISISLDAQDSAVYEKICKPSLKDAYPSVIEFIKEASRHIPVVEVSVVETEGVDVSVCKSIANRLGVGFRLRSLDVVG